MTATPATPLQQECDDATFASSVAQFQASANRGIAWILAQQRADGSFCTVEDGVGSYYKVPYTLALAGQLRPAQRLLNWVAQHHLTAEGNFRAAERKAREPIHDSWPVYANAWLILGAQRLGRWDLARRGMAFLENYQLPIGGFYALDGERPFLEPVGVAWGGLAALSTGYLPQAQRAGTILVRMVEQQPDVQRFYFRMDEQGQLITAPPPGGELQTYVDATRPKQIYYNPGIALIFLCHLYRATGEGAYLQAAEQILAFTERCASDVHRFPPSGKLGCGAALLYALTGNPVAQRAAVNVGAYLVESQNAAGWWGLPDEEPYSSLANKDSYDVILDVTAEFSTFLLEIAALV
ncbi:MAG: hypothetical protein U0350_10775 [Caldilineaceae bacterium]